MKRYEIVLPEVFIKAHYIRYKSFTKQKVFKIVYYFHSPTLTQTGHKIHWALSILMEMNELQINL